MAPKAARRYQVAKLLEGTFALFLGAQAAVESNARVPMNSAPTIEHVADVLDPDLLDADTDREWGSAVPLWCLGCASSEFRAKLT